MLDEQWLDQLAALDQQIIENLDNDDIDVAMPLSAQLQQRESLLQQIALLTKVDSLRWQQALDRTKTLIARLADKRSATQSTLKKLNHGHRSVTLYNKFR
ncbi:flagellar rod protein FlaI [Thaumasiovibrio sp. DFM-14]|uniref:flagellar rod protein FlaI n=1 Tax=Thaumasiovibrio sp. DFM-14 TaxID=3384792 RepID=UPI0039A1D0BA